MNTRCHQQKVAFQRDRAITVQLTGQATVEPSLELRTGPFFFDILINIQELDLKQLSGISRKTHLCSFSYFST